MVISNPNAVAATNAANGGGAGSLAHPSGIPQDQIDNIMSGIANTGDVKMNNHRKKLKQRFDIIKKLGQGTYGKVQLGINKETGQEVAIKTIKKCKIEAEADLVRIRREVQIMSSVQHPNIIHIYEVFENREKMVLVMEFAAGGELYDYLSERKVLSEEEARRIFRQVATAVYYCHKHKICHRDLKLENILLDEHGNAKIADFGLSNVFDDQRLLATFCGSPLYASPEIVEGTPYQGPEVDCWSLGVLLYTLVYGSMPFDGSNFKRLVKQISQGDYYEPKKPSRASSLIRDMLTVSPRKRATIEQICSHWWVNENDPVSCLELAENLANQTPVRLDVLLSLTPAAITADQLVVPSADGSKSNERVPRSHSVGSIRDMAPNTEAERRILDMVAAGGEAALMPSPTRTITPAQSPVQSKRKLETTISTENAVGALKKKEKPGSSALVAGDTAAALNEEDVPMETDEMIGEEPLPTPAVKNTASGNFSQKDMELVGDLCEQLIQKEKPTANAGVAAAEQLNIAVPENNAAPIVPRQRTMGKLDSVVEAPEEKDATKVIKQFVNKRKTADLVNAIGQITPEKANEPATETTNNNTQTVPAIAKQRTPPATQNTTTTPAPAASAPAPFVRKCSLQDESSLNKFNTEQRRKSRILETAEKFQQMNAGNGGDKPKKFSIPGVSVGSFKKEFERKATTPAVKEGPTAGELRAMEQVAEAAATAQEYEQTETEQANVPSTGLTDSAVESSDSKTSVASLSLEDARRSMENSIALLRQAQSESSKEVDQLCAKTENIEVSEPTYPTTAADRERKLKNARAIIGNAIQPVIRRPTPFSGIGGGGYGQMRAVSGSQIGHYGGGCNSPFAIQTPTPPYLLTSSTTNHHQMPANANVALAAARQHIMGRLAAGGHSLLVHQNSIPSSYMQSNSLYNNQNHNNNSHTNINNITISSSSQQLNQHLFQQNQQQQKQHQQQQYPQSFASQSQLDKQQQSIRQLLLQQQQLPRQYHEQQKQQQTMPPSYAASAPCATAANANAFVTTTTTTTATINSVPKPFYNAPPPSSIFLKSSPGGDSNTVKTSTATITLKSATLPRRKPTAKTEIQLEIKPRIVEQPNMRFTTEMQHPVADLRSAPPRDGPAPYSPIKTMLNARATSLEPKEHIIPIHRQQAAYTRTASNTTTRSGSLSRQSTNDSESESTTTNLSQSTLTGSSQPIKKSPREFIIPIAMEGGGFITPREGSIEPSESSHTTSSRSTFNRLRPTRRIGSLLNDSGIENSLPFQNIRTASGSRDGDDEGRFTLHRLRSSRPVKKLSQDNDSQSSGEEDDDDGFEILTAENLFSTLLQRVHALTHRLNVDRDLTAGFPNSTRLLGNMRPGHSSFWNQPAFGSRLNNTAGNSVGAPWRHSMSRDLSSDMNSLFSRSGATLPRGNKSSKHNRPLKPDSTEDTDLDKCSASNSVEVPVINAEDPLDLADLDLSRLRLSKKDLETLSSITPGLPKYFQEQLLAKLPPTQARKLSRTLSMQNSTTNSTPSVKVYKRSQSGGRGTLHEPVANLTEQLLVEETADSTASKSSTEHADLSERERPERRTYNPVYRRSLSRSRYDYESSIPTPSDAAMSKSRSSSVCRDDYSKSLCSSYTSEINDRYKYYSPYLSKSLKDSSTESGGSTTSQKRYGSISPRDVPASAALGRPPSGYLSPPPTVAADNGSSSLRRRSSQRRISRFLRPDFFEEPLGESAYQREKRQRERETQNVLREIREKSRESSRERMTQSTYGDCGEELHARKHSLPNAESADLAQKANAKHVRNKSMELYPEYQSSSSSQENMRRNRRSLSRPRDMNEDLRTHELADKILQELQLLSTVRTQQENCGSMGGEVKTDELGEGVGKETVIVESEQTSTIKKVKKVKPKEKLTEAGNEPDGQITTAVVKKVKKIVKKTETIKTICGEGVTAPSALNTDEAPLTLNEADQPKKESKLKRPKSYPTKEAPLAVLKTDTPTSPPVAKLIDRPSTTAEANNELANGSAGGLRESRLIRPKSYPTSKLTPPKDLKKVTRSGAAIATINEATTPPQANESNETLLVATTTPKMNVDTSSSSETRPTSIKKIIKVSKKSKLVQPTAVTPTTPTPTTTPADNSKESSPTVKEKSPEKRPSKGLLYAIGQKFEKLRDSAMNKEKKSSASASPSASSANGSIVTKRSLENGSPEKIKEKTTLLRKKKSLDSTASTKSDKSQLGNDVTTPKTAKTPTAGNELSEKPIKADKRSRIDAMIRSLRERSVPRSRPATESNYIKRAVSVEEMPGTFNKNAVNRVLGLFKRSDKDGSGERRVQSTRSTSNIERQIRESTPSPIYQNAAIERQLAGSTPINKKTKSTEEANCSCDLATPLKSKVAETACAECMQDQVTNNLVTKRREESSNNVDATTPMKEHSQGNKDKRKGLMLDLIKLEKNDNTTPASRSSKSAYINGNSLYSNLPPYPGAVNSSSNNSSSQHSVDNTTNNNNSYMTNNNSSMPTSQTSGYRTSSAHEINRNHLLTPSTENIANYSSDSRSYQDDCASTSTFLSPTDEPELYFDNWSVCSEDNYMLHATPSPTVSRLSRASQLSSPTRGESSDPNESVIDRIKRRSFYCRFNDKKPKRTSSIVGPSAVREYYREQQAAVKARSNNKLNASTERAKSPDITQEFFRPLKLSPVGTELKPPIYKSPLDYNASLIKPRKSLNDIRQTTSPALHSKRYGSTLDNDYLSSLSSSGASGATSRYKPSSTTASASPYESKSSAAGKSGYYNTYSPQRRSSYTFNGTLPSGTGITNSNLDGYATVGRRPIRAYDQRTMSLLDTNSHAASASTGYRREARTPVRDYTSSISRSNSRYRTGSASRSPTNI